MKSIAKPLVLTKCFSTALGYSIFSPVTGSLYAVLHLIKKSRAKITTNRTSMEASRTS